MICEKCGAQLKKDAKICPSCGTPLQAVHGLKKLPDLEAAPEIPRENVRRSPSAKEPDHSGRAAALQQQLTRERRKNKIMVKYLLVILVLILISNLITMGMVIRQGSLIKSMRDEIKAVTEQGVSDGEENAVQDLQNTSVSGTGAQPFDTPEIAADTPGSTVGAQPFDGGQITPDNSESEENGMSDSSQEQDNGGTDMTDDEDNENEEN